jgi:hypothetical protein
MKIATLAPGDRGKGLDNDFGESNSSTLKLKKPKEINRLKVLDELARKWVRYGCAETPKEALRMLLGGAR